MLLDVRIWNDTDVFELWVFTERAPQMAVDVVTIP